MRIGFEHQPVHERAGIAFIAVADDVSDRIGLRAADRPFARRGEARAAASAQAGIGDGTNDFVRRAVLNAIRQRAVAIAHQVVIDAQRVDFAAILQHDALLLAGVRKRIGGGIAREEPAGPQVLAHDRRRGLGRDIAVQCDAPVRPGDFHHRLAIAHAVAADRFDCGACAQLRGRLFQRRAHRLGAAGDAARAQADADLDQY